MSSFESHSRTFSLLTMVSRVTGLARDAALSRVFGGGALMDAFFFAFILPNLFRRLFGEGAASAAFLRVYARLDSDDPDTARRLATLMLAGSLVVLGVITLLVELVLASLMTTVTDSLPLRLMMIMLPYMPLVCLVAIISAMLQVRGRFGPTAVVPVVLNGGLIAATLGLRPLFDDPGTHLTAVAASVIVAGGLQVAWMAWCLGFGALARRGLAAAREPMREVLRQAGPMILGLGIFQLNAFLDGLIASYPTTIGPTIFGVEYPLREGAMAAVSFAQRLYQFPLGVFGLAVATAIYPALSRLADDAGGFADTLRRGLRLVFFVGLPASAGLMIVGPQLSAVFFRGGSFTDADTQRVAVVLFGYAAGVWAYSGVHVLTRAFYARGDAMTPVRVAVAMVTLNLVLNMTLIWTPLREAGLAWSTALCAWLQAAMLTMLARRHVTALLDRPVRRSMAATFALTIAMSAAVIAVLATLPDHDTWLTALAHLSVAVVTGVVVYGAGAALLRRPELRWVTGMGSDPI